MIKNQPFRNPRGNFNTSRTQSDSFMKGLLDDLKNNGMEKALSLDNVKKYKNEFGKINSSSALRKVYDAYLDFYENDDKEYEIKFALWIAKLAYQEKRPGTNLPKGITEFMEKVHSKLGKQYFKQFLEAFVAYHKYFTGYK